MPASIPPQEIGIECNKFAFLPGPREDKDGDSCTFLQGPSVPINFEKPEPLLSSGATTPGEESSELDDQSDYEFNADGQEEYYDFLREMGCDFKQSPDDESEDDGSENELEEEGNVEFNDDGEELEEEDEVEFDAHGQEDYYDFLREMGCPFEERVADDEEEEEEEWEEEWVDKTNGAASYRVPYAETSHANACSLLEEAGMVESQPAYNDRDFSDPYDDCDDFSHLRFRPDVTITPGPSLCLQKALMNVAAQRTNELPSLERHGSWEIIHCKDFVQSC